MMAAVVLLEGSWAVAAMDGATGRIVGTAHRAPLLAAESARGSFLASDVLAIARWIDAFRVVEDGDIVEIGADGLWIHDGEPTPAPTAIRHRYVEADGSTGGYPDHMAKEIDEQPLVAAGILDRIAPRIPSGALWRDLGLAPFQRVAI